VLIYDFRLLEGAKFNKGFGRWSYEVLQDALRKKGIKRIELRDVIGEVEGFWAALGFRFSADDDTWAKELR